MLYDVQVLDVVDDVLADGDRPLVGDLALLVGDGHAVHSEAAGRLGVPGRGERDVDVAVVDGGLGVAEDPVAVGVVTGIRAVEVVALGGAVQMLGRRLSGHHALGLDLHGQLVALEIEHDGASGTGFVQLRQVDLVRLPTLGESWTGKAQRQEHGGGHGG